MKIVLSELKEGVPLSVRETYDPKALGLELVDLKFLEMLEMTGTVLMENQTVHFSGNLTSRVRRICGRTLKETKEDLDVPFDLYYQVRDLEVIETLDDLREAVLLAQPMVYYAPGTESKETVYEDKLPEKGDAADSSIENNPFAKLKKLRDRLKEE